MQTRYNFNNKYILQWKNLNINNSVRLLKNIQKPSVILTFNFNNLKSKDFLNLIEGLYFLEVISGQRPFIQKIQKFKKLRKTGSDFKVQVNLRKFYAENWFDFFKEFILMNILKDESIKFDFKVTELGNCLFLLKNLSFIPGLAEEGLYWKHSLKVDLIFNSKDSNQTKLMLKQMGFYNNNNK